MRSQVFFFFAILFLVSACSSPKTEVVINPTANYSIEKQDGWLSQVEGPITRFLKPSSTVETQTGIVMVTTVDGMFDNLEDNFKYELSFLPQGLNEFKKLDEGTVTIDNKPARWVRISDFRKDTEFITVMYVQQAEGTKCIAFNCSAPKESFPEFEEEMKKIVLSFKKTKK